MVRLPHLSIIISNYLICFIKINLSKNLIQFINYLLNLEIFNILIIILHEKIIIKFFNIVKIFFFIKIFNYIILNNKNI